MNGDPFGEITTRNDIARDIIAGFAAVTPTLAGVWRLVDRALADVPAVLAELGRARAELEAVRLDRANLLAAIRATLAADAEGEADPLGYLRDELDTHRHPGAAPGGGHDQLPADAQADPPRPPRRTAADRGHRQRRPVPRAGRRGPRPARVAVPLRDRARLHGGRGARRRAGGSTPRTRTGGRTCSAYPPYPPGCSWRSARGSACPGSPSGSTPASVTFAAGGWLAAAALLGPLASPLPQVLGVGAVVLAVPWWAHRRRRAKVRVQRTLAAWPDISRAIGLPGSPGHVRGRGPVGMAGTAPPGPRADHRRRDRADTRHRIGARHLPRRGPRLPHPRRQGQPVRTARARHRPARRSDPVARAVRTVHHRARGPRAVRGRRAVPRVVPAPARAVRRHDRVGQERRTQRPHGHPRRVRRRGHLGHRPQEGHGTRPLGTVHRPPGDHARGGRRDCSPTP